MSLTLASPANASLATMERCGEFEVRLVVRHTFLQLAPSETGATPCTFRRIASDNMIDYKLYGDDSDEDSVDSMIDDKRYGDDSDEGSVRCSLASLDTYADSEIPSDLQSVSSSESMSNCCNGGWCDVDTDDEGAIEAAQKMAKAMTSPVADRWCDADTDDEGAAETAEKIAQATSSPVLDQQGLQECWPTFYFTPLSAEHQVMALQAQASQLRAQARQAEDVAELTRKACSRTAGQHSKRSRKRAERRLGQLQLQQQEQWQQHCDQSWPQVCATVGFTPCAPPGKF